MSDQNQAPQGPPNQVLAALIARFEAERLEAIACLNLYINHPLAVADHPNVVGEAARLVSAISSAEGCLRTLQAAVTPPPGQSDES